MALSRRGVVTLGVLGGSFLAAIEATIVATAMPTVVTQLGGLAHFSWVFSGYLLTSTVSMPIWGKLSDLHGRRNYYLAAIGLFLLGSAMSGASQSMTQLIVFRAIQGLGAGGLLPLGMTILGEQYTLAERARMQALFSGVWGLASIIGPLVGGYITDAISWRWVFYLNIPFGLVAAGLVGAALVDPPRAQVPRVDYRGALAMMGSVAVLMIALGQTGHKDAVVDGPALAALYVLSLVLGAIFVWIERRSEEPILPLDLMTHRLVLSTTVAGFLTGVAMFGALSFVPLFVQSVLGGGAAEAGEALAPLLIGWVGMSVVAGRILPRFGFRPLVLSGLSLLVVGFIGLVQVGHDSRPSAMYFDLAIMGMGMGLTMLTLLLALQSAVPRSRLGVATSVGQFSRSIGGAVGVSIMGAIVAASLPPGGETVPAAMEVAIHRAFLAGAIVAVLALLASFGVPSGKPTRGEPTTGVPSET